METETTDLEALEHFVVQNEALSELETRIGRFNIFDALGTVNAEIRHSNFLAWLLDPGESHGQGGLFLNAFLMDLLRQTPPDQRLFSPIKLDGGELRGVEVRREWKNIDLLITCDDPSFVIAIENKVHSVEGPNQLSRYEEIVHTSTEFARHKKRQLVFLTREGDLPSEETWTIYSYADLHRALQRVRAANAEQIGDDVRTFLDHYLRLIGSRFMDDAKITELCQEIYKNHRQAIRLIIDRVGAERSVALQTIDELLEADDQWDVLKKSGKATEFLPAAWSDRIRAESKDPKKPWIYFEFNMWGESICGMNVCLRRAKKPELRDQCFQTWMTDPKRYGLKTRKKPLAENWNSLQRVTLAKWPDGEEVPIPRIEEAATKLLQKTAVTAEELCGVFSAK